MHNLRHTNCAEPRSNGTTLAPAHPKSTCNHTRITQNRTPFTLPYTTTTLDPITVTQHPAIEALNQIAVTQNPAKPTASHTHIKRYRAPKPNQTKQRHCRAKSPMSHASRTGSSALPALPVRHGCAGALGVVLLDCHLQAIAQRSKGFAFASSLDIGRRLMGSAPTN